jgi:tetratricopeptide (TPR) repeat protein
MERGLGNRSALLRHAANQFTYMLNLSSPKFILMPEIHLKMGVTQELMGKRVEALKHFLQAIKLKRDYVPAYLKVINFYKELHDVESAARIARTGLKYSPNSKTLQNELRELQSLSDK